MEWGVANLATLEDCELRGDAFSRILGIGNWGGDKVEAARAFAVEAEVFGEGLGNAEFKPFGDEVTEGPGIVGEVAACEALISAVEEWEVAFGSYNGGNFLPLLLCGVYSCGVVGTGVEKYDASFRGSTKSRDHAIEVKALGRGVEVRVGLDREVYIAENLVVIGPGRVGEVNRLGRGAAVEFG
jgi:hypothetical protein